MRSPSPSTEPLVELCVPAAAVSKLSLSMQEGLFVSRLAPAGSRFSSLVSLTGMTAQQVQTVLSALVARGVVRLVGGNAASMPVLFRDEDLADGRDLSLEQKKAILTLDGRLEQLSHYEVLGIPRRALVDAIKAAYLERSRLYHPDAFFRRDLGGYAARIDRIFRQLKLAHSTLADPELRAAYDKTLPLEAVAAPPMMSEEQRAREDRHQARVRETRLKKNPLVDRVLRAREMVVLADDAMHKQKFDEAANHARIALSFDPGLQDRVAGLVAAASAGKCKLLILELEATAKTGKMRSGYDLSASVDVLIAGGDAATLARTGRALLTLQQFKLAYQVATHDEARMGASMWEIAAEAAAGDERWPLVLRAAERWLMSVPSNNRAKALHRLAKGRS